MEMNCAKCKIVDKLCRLPDGRAPTFCPTLTKKEIIDKALKEATHIESSEQLLNEIYKQRQRR